MATRARRLLAVLAGLGVAFGIIFGVEAFTSALYPLPPGADPSNAEAMRAAQAHAPVGTLLLVLLGWSLGSIAGGWVATRVGARERTPARAIALILLASAIFNMTTFPHPLWFWIAGVLLFFPFAELGAALAGAKPPAGT